MKTIKASIFILTAIFFTYQLEGQTLNQYLKSAEEAYEGENYPFALYSYRKALEIDSTQSGLFLKAAESARKMLGYNTSAYYYTKYLNQFPPDSVPDKRAYFWYGLSLMNQGLYDSAAPQFEHYLAEIDSNELFYGQKARLSLESCDFAQLLIENPLNVEIDTSLREEINTPQSDFAPYYLDGKLYYTSMQFEPQKKDPILEKNISKIMYWEDEDTHVLDTNVNDINLLTGNQSFNSDGTHMYFTVCRYLTSAVIECNLYMSNRLSDDKWSPRIKLPDNINYEEATTTHPTVMLNPSDGKEYLIFASDRPGGEGSLDLWISEILGNNLYGTPKNMEAINTFDDDMTPFYHAESNKLYFATSGRKGLGELDIYQAQYRNGRWSDISNVGYPVNGPTNDFYPFILNGGRIGYFASNRPGSIIFYEEEEACCYDIYKFTAVSQSRTIYLSTLMNTPLEFRAQPIDLSNTVVTRMQESSHGKSIQNPDSLMQFVYLPNKDFIGQDKLVIGLCSDEGLSFCDTINYIIDVRPIPTEIHEFTTKEFTKLSDCVPLIGFSRNDSLTIVPCDDGLQNGRIEYTVLNDKLCFEYLPNYGFLGLDQMCLEICNSNPKDKCVRKILKFNVIEENMEAQLPVVLYFDNDVPKPVGSSGYSDKNYMSLHSNYLIQKAEFIQQYTALLDQEEQRVSISEMNSFFENVVGACDEDLKRFAQTLLRMLDDSRVIEIYIKGFASPRAEAAYNEQLSKRRIQTIVNYLKEFEDGALAEYIEKDELKIIEKPIGEAQSPDYVSDDINDPRNSIFSIEASVERRVEIVEVNRLN